MSEPEFIEFKNYQDLTGPLKQYSMLVNPSLPTHNLLHPSQGRELVCCF